MIAGRLCWWCSREGFGHGIRPANWCQLLLLCTVRLSRHVRRCGSTRRVRHNGRHDTNGTAGEGEFLNAPATVVSVEQCRMRVLRRALRAQAHRVDLACRRSSLSVDRICRRTFGRLPSRSRIAGEAWMGWGPAQQHACILRCWPKLPSATRANMETTCCSIGHRRPFQPLRSSLVSCETAEG